MKIKTIIFFILITLSLNLLAQLPTNVKTGAFEFSEIVLLDGLTKADIYKKAKFWMVSTLKSGDNMVELDGSKSDQVIGTGNLVMKIDEEFEKKYSIKDNVLNFKFIVFCKDNKLKYSISNFDLVLLLRSGNELRIDISDIKNYPGLGKSKKSQELQTIYKESIYKSINENIESLVKNFISSIKTAEEEW